MGYGMRIGGVLGVVVLCAATAWGAEGGAAKPRFAARTFNSDVPLRVVVQEKSGGEWRTIGRTPAPNPLKIPACHMWAVSPSRKDLASAVAVVRRENVPGLILDGRMFDTDLELIRDLSGLRYLRLGGEVDRLYAHPGGHLKGRIQERWWREFNKPEVTDAGLANLKGLAALERLILAETKVTDRGLAHLKGLAALRSLGLWRTNVTDAGLVHLRDLTALETLNLKDTKVTDAGLVHLRDLTALKTLDLRDTVITGPGLVHLKGLTALEVLYLGDTYVTDAGLAHLKGLTNLRMLLLGRTNTTDAGLMHLKRLRDLEYLQLAMTAVTDAGLKDLQKSLPYTEIVWGPPPRWLRFPLRPPPAP